MAADSSEERRDVLLVEDDDALRNRLQLSLQSHGYIVDALESANHTLRFLDRKPWVWTPWILITDLVMDGMGGYELMRRVQQKYPKKIIPMVVISRLCSNEDRNEAELAGANFFIPKPFKDAELLDVLSQIIEEQRANKAKKKKAQGPFRA